MKDTTTKMKKTIAVSRPSLLSKLIKNTLAFAAGFALVAAANAETGPAEKTELKFGFIKLTDMVPLAVAYENGYFDDEGLSVELEAQANWKVVLDRVITGELDGSHMLAGQPIGSTIGFGTNAHIVTSFVMDLNGNGLTVANDVWKKMKKNIPVDADGKFVHPIKADALKPVIKATKDAGQTFPMGMVFPVSTHNYEIRYWLAAAGIHPGFYAPAKGDITGQIKADVLLSVTPPPQMPATLEAGTIKGYMVGEPWNQQAVFRGIGVPIVTNNDIHSNFTEKVFGVTKDWSEKNPNTHIRVVKALIRAAKWLDENSNANRPAAAKMISASHYVGADYKVIANSMTGVFEYDRGDLRKQPDFNVFFRYNANFPYYSDAIWYLTQMRRWGQIAEAKPDSWYTDTAKKVFLPEVYRQAVKDLIDEGKMAATDFPELDKTDGFRKPEDTKFIDGKTFDASKPNDYLKQFEIGLKGDEQI
nr:CmpA/NrtA family ABC transporter substrate-binding protein [Cellvibrio sp. NN19]